MKRTLVIIAAVAGVLLLAAAGLGALAWCKLDSLHQDTVQVVKKPDIVAVPTPEIRQDETLVKLEETPEDVGEDYQVDIDEETAAQLKQEDIFETAVIDENVINVLLVGQDTGLEWNASTRSDSCMILSYDRAAGSVKTVSVMRDTWTPIEGHGWNRINAAYSFGGVGLLINTINEVYDLDIQYYVITGFDEFEAVIDELGGLDMELTAKEAAYLNKTCGTDLAEGMNHLNGAMALMHARNRRTGDGDFGRIRRQRDLLLAAYKKVRSISDVGTWLSLMEFGMGNIRTNIDPAMMVTLGLEALQNDARDDRLDRDAVPLDLRRRLRAEEHFE